jgi:MFS family permease
MALAAALLGWMFDGFEQGMFPLVARPALMDVLHLSSGDNAGRMQRIGQAIAVQGLATAAVASPGVPQVAVPLEIAAPGDNVDRLVGLWNGRITAAFLVGAALGGWAFGWLGDRIGRVRAMIFSVLTYSIFAGLCGLAATPWQLAALRFLSALGMGGEWALGVALVMETWAPHARPVLAGLIGAAANVGFVLTGLLGLAMASANVSVAGGGWRWVLGFCALPALLTFFLRLFVPESERWREAVRSTPRAGLAAIFTPALRGRTVMAAVISSIPLLATWGSVTWIPTWVNQLTNNDAVWASLSQVAGGLGAIAGALCGAVLGGRVPRRWAYIGLCLGSLVVCAFLFRVVPVGETGVGWSFLGVVLLTGALSASFYGWLPLYLPEMFPTRVRATGQGFGYNFGRIIAAVGTLNSGRLISDVFAGDYGRMGATVTLIYLAGLVVIWLAPETRGQPLPE